MQAGIIAQYGFLYQRYVFIKMVLDNVGVDKYFVYEGKDDIDIVEQNQIIGITVENNSFVQVKSGIVSKECWSKVIGNWLLIDDGEAKYNLFLENELSFDKNQLDYVYKFFQEGKNKQKTSIANKVYKQFIVGRDGTEEGLKEKCADLINRVSFQVATIDELLQSIADVFISTYCQDIRLYPNAKEYRLLRFIEHIQTEIDKSLGKRVNYTLRYQDFINQIGRVTAEISDEKYVVDTTEIKKRKKPEAEKIFSDEHYREVEQLRLVDDRKEFVVSELVKELLYKDLRDVYSSGYGQTIISNMEDIAYTNYEETMFDLPEEATPRQLFKETTRKEIPSQIIDNSPIYRNGCYTYLTGAEIDEEKQITWGKEHE